MGQGTPQGLAYYRVNRGAGWSDNISAGLNLADCVMTVNIGGSSDPFTVSGGSYISSIYRVPNCHRSGRSVLRPPAKRRLCLKP